MTLKRFTGVKMRKVDTEIKEAVIEALKEHGTMQYASKVCGVSVKTLNREMNRSAVFKKRVFEAREEGKRNIADKAIDRIKEYAFNPPPKTDRNVLTAAIALANAYEPGFRGTTTVQGKIDHDVRVITAVPRPKYEIEKKLLDTPPKKVVKSKKVEIYDDKGEYIGTQTVGIEGEVVNDD